MPYRNHDISLQDTFLTFLKNVLLLTKILKLNKQSK